MEKMVILIMQDPAMVTQLKRMALHMTTDMLFLTTDISLLNTTVTSMWRSVHPLNQSSTSTSTSSKDMTVPLWSFEMTRTVMRSRSIWMHVTLDLSRAATISLNSPCMLLNQQSIDSLFI